LFEEILSRNEEDRLSRIKRLNDEMYHPENLPFITRKNINYCLVCEKDDEKQVKLESFGDYYHHLCLSHGKSPADLIVYLLEQILEAVLFQKRMNATSKGEFSN